MLAIAIRHYGIALWDTKGDSGVQMWSGMSYKTMFNPLRKSMLADIVRLEVAAIAQRLNATHQASLWAGPGATLDRSHQPEGGDNM